MNPEALYYFLGQCLALDEHPGDAEEIGTTLGRLNFPWENTVLLGSHHLVLPSLYVKWKNARLLPILPDELVTHLEHLYSLNLERNKRLAGQINWLHCTLQDAGIGSVFLKGAAALADSLYPDPGERVIGDIDCLVRPDQLSRAVELLRDHGYSSASFHPASLPLMHHYPSFFKQGAPAQIELHHIPVGRRQLKYMGQEPLNALLRDPAKSDIPRIPRYGEQLMINLIHSQVKDLGQFYARVPLRNVYEFYRLSLRSPSDPLPDAHPRLRVAYNNYKGMADRLFRPDTPFPYRRNLPYRLFFIRFHLSHSSRSYYRYSRFSRSLRELAAGYFRIIMAAVTRKSHRLYLFARLSSPAWYRHHLSVLGKRFSTRH